MAEKGAYFKYLKVVTYATLVINIVSIILSLFGEYPISSIAGYLYIGAICLNILVIFFNFMNINTADAKGKFLKILCYIYLVFLFFAMFMLLFSQIIFIIQEDPTSIRLIIAELTHWIVYFGVLGFALLLALLDLKYFTRPETWVPQKS
jgi:hypothetical protein